MDLPVPAATLLTYLVEAQDAPTLEAQANKLLAALAFATPTFQVCGFDVGCQGNAATWSVGLFVDGSGVAPPVPQVEVPLPRALVFCFELENVYGPLGAPAQAAYALQRALTPFPAALVVCSRVTGGGAGGKWLVSYLVDKNNVTPPPPPAIVAPSDSSLSSTEATHLERDEHGRFVSVPGPADDDNG